MGLIKEKYDHSHFLRHLPAEFRAFLNHLSSLTYTDTPHYQALQGLVQQCMHRKGWRCGECSACGSRIGVLVACFCGFGGVAVVLLRGDLFVW